jgi:hypothetical protein
MSEVVMSETVVAASDPVPVLRCPNCQTPLLGAYCYVCGQPKKGFIRQLSGILADFFDTVFDLDSRLLRTLPSLYLRPGFLSLEYFAGRRVRYVTPLRLYFFITVIAFLAMSMVSTVKVAGGANGIQIDFDETPATPAQLDADEQAALAGLDSGRPFMPDLAYQRARSDIKAQFAEQRRAQTAVAAPAAPASAPPPVAAKPPPARSEAANDPNPLHLRFAEGKDWHPEHNPLRFAWLGSAGNAWLNQQVGLIVRNTQAAKHDPQRLVTQSLSKAPQVLLVVLPLFALLLKVILVFRRRLYMEHLIVALHSHSFLALSGLLLVAVSQGQTLLAAGFWHSVFGIGYALIWLWIPVYLLIAQKRIYRQNWVMAVLSYGLIGIGYSVLLAFGMVFNVLLSLATL